MKKTALILALAGLVITTLSLLIGIVFRSYFTGKDCFPLCIVEPAPSLDGQIVNLFFGPAGLIIGSLLLVSGFYLRGKK